MVSEPQRCTAQSLPRSPFGAQLPLQATAWQTTDDWKRKGRGDKKQVHFIFSDGKWERWDHMPEKNELVSELGQSGTGCLGRLQSYSKTRGKKVPRCLIHHQQPCFEQGAAPHVLQKDLSTKGVLRSHDRSASCTPATTRNKHGGRQTKQSPVTN